MKLLHPNFRTLHTVLDVLEVPSDSPPHMIISLPSIGFRREYPVRKGKEDVAYSKTSKVLGESVPSVRARRITKLAFVSSAIRSEYHSQLIVP